MIEEGLLLFWAFLLILLTILIFSLLSKNHRYMLAIFFPSWKFFDRYEAEPFVSYSVDSKDWINLDWKVKRGFFQLFFNPEGNLRLYFYSQIEKLLFELSENSDIQLNQLKNIITYRNICELLLIRLMSKESRFSAFQFRISIKDDQAVGDTAVFVSPVIEVHQ